MKKESYYSDKRGLISVKLPYIVYRNDLVVKVELKQRHRDTVKIAEHYQQNYADITLFQRMVSFLFI